MNRKIYALTLYVEAMNVQANWPYAQVRLSIFVVLVAIYTKILRVGSLWLSRNHANDLILNIYKNNN